MYPEHPDSYRDTLHYITILAIPVHILGTYCILVKTPKTMVSVKWIMLNFHVCCMVLDYGISVLTVPYMIFPALGGFPLGILTEFGIPIEIQSYFILTLVPVVSSAVITLFENRYFIVFAQNTKWRHYRCLVSIINYSCSVTWSLPAFFLVPDQKMAIKTALEMLGPIPSYIRNGPMYVLSLEIKYVTLPCFLMASLIAVQAVMFVTLMTRELKKLKKTARFSENTLKMQRNFLHAIYIQVTVYMASIQVPLAYFVVSILFKFYCQSANNIGIIIFSFNGLSSTIVMIWIHKPYRDFCYKFLRIEKWRKKTSQVISQGAISSIAPNSVRNVVVA
ncbi:hypothetical protein CRE_05783 [Caenorhabditis remanei]|uniref:Uncharacterized protein n=1 Tax=Caenorhabditis remanei TaxID=31234 RepID=E3M023_CAERE|nr:hypothetical protein CRE_05783 [Caenorhabditis remanei]